MTSYLSKRFRAGVQFAPVDVKFGSFVPEPPGVQQVAVVLDPALYTCILHHFNTRALTPHTHTTALSQHYKGIRLICIFALQTLGNNLIRK